ncbi:Chemotaxis protein methyltransferase CheR [Candidatus Burkholderia humilis]|nr:Chemotaxis protein methyltransferase CheR [Candidatus Burkholderia humilis]
MGHEVALAGNGAQAVEVAAQFGPDVVILDLGMPLLDGLAAARALRRLPNGAGMLLVALTGWGQPQHREMTQDAGFDMHLVSQTDLSRSAAFHPVNDAALTYTPLRHCDAV